MIKNKKQINRKLILMVMVIPLFFLLFAKLMYIQIILHGKINGNVEKMINCKRVEMSKRGDILDSKGKILVSSVKKYTVFIDPKTAKDFDKIKNVLSENGIKIKEKNLTDFGKTSYVPLASNIDTNVVDKIKSEKLKGIGFESKYIRQYPEGRLLAHILGIIGTDGNGLDGVEKICDEYLSGNKIMIKTIRDGRGNIIQDKFIDKTKMSGKSIELTIDGNIQFIAEQELRKAFDKYKAKKAICIIQNPNTGAILAMVSLPDFDSSSNIKDVKLLRNSAISDVYEPGSTFKIVTFAAALEQGKVKLTDSFYLENGAYKIFNHTIRDDHKITGYASLSKTIEQSSNIGAVKIAERLGSRDFYEYIRKFGFYSLTGIDLPGEAKGILADSSKWNALSLPTISFGQGICVTAIQTINAFSAIANDGILMKPYVVHRKTGNKTQENISEAKEIRRVISVDTARTMKKLLKNTVNFGTGKSARVPRYTVGGKTGTAQKVDPAIKTYSTKYYTASFCGMAPAMEPKIVVLVVIDEPKGGNYYAASVASPVFVNITEKTLQYLGVEKDGVN